MSGCGFAQFQKAGDLKMQIVVLEEARTDSSRQVPITSVAENALHEYLDHVRWQQGHEWLLRGEGHAIIRWSEATDSQPPTQRSTGATRTPKAERTGRYWQMPAWQSC